MKVRDKLDANAQKHLQQGETIQQVMRAQTTNEQVSVPAMCIDYFKHTYRVIVVTDRRIFVAMSGRFSMTPVNDIVHEAPRSTKLGPLPRKGRWHKCETLGNTLYINKYFFKDIQAADADASGASA